jgi:hypothetical protein
LFYRQDVDDFDNLHVFHKLYVLEVDGKMSSLGMVHWVPSDFNVTCVVTMYGTIDTLVMLNSTKKSKSHFPSFVITMNVMSSFLFVKKISLPTKLWYMWGQPQRNSSC